MDIAYFPNQVAINGAPVLSAFLQGCNRLGMTTVENSLHCDMAVIWSVLWSGRMRDNEKIMRTYRESGRPVIVLEVGMLHRGHTWKLGLNGIGPGCYRTDDLQPNRAARLGIDLRPWRTQGRDIVIALQRTDSDQWCGVQPMDQWLPNLIRAVQQHTNRPIVVRAHPRQRVCEIPGIDIQYPKKLPGTYDSFDFESCLSTAWAVINHSSGPGVQAVLNGVPAFVSPNSLAFAVANNDLSNIENPNCPDRTLWLEHLCHTEWTTEELSTGQPLQRLLVDHAHHALVQPRQDQIFLF